MLVKTCSWWKQLTADEPALRRKEDTTATFSWNANLFCEYSWNHPSLSRFMCVKTYDCPLTSWRWKKKYPSYSQKNLFSCSIQQVGFLEFFKCDVTGCPQASSIPISSWLLIRVWFPLPATDIRELSGWGQWTHGNATAGHQDVATRTRAEQERGTCGMEWAMRSQSSGEWDRGSRRDGAEHRGPRWIMTWGKKVLVNEVVSWTEGTGPPVCHLRRKSSWGKRLCRKGWERAHWEGRVPLKGLCVVLSITLQLPITGCLMELTLNDILLGIQIASAVQIQVILLQTRKRNTKQD